MSGSSKVQVTAYAERKDGAMFLRNSWFDLQGNGLEIEVTQNIGSPHVIVRIDTGNGKAKVQYAVDIRRLAEDLAEKHRVERVAAPGAPS